MSKDLVTVPYGFGEAIEAVRETGLCNMMDRECVQTALDGDGHFTLVLWLEDHPREYGSAIMRGFLEAAS